MFIFRSFVCLTVLKMCVSSPFVKLVNVINVDFAKIRLRNFRGKCFTDTTIFKVHVIDSKTLDCEKQYFNDHFNMGMQIGAHAFLSLAHLYMINKVKCP